MPFPYRMPRARLAAILAKAVVAVVAGHAAACASATFQQELTAADGAAHDAFGNAVAVSGGTMVVGSLNAGNYGAAYVFAWNGTAWEQTAKLTGDNAVYGEHFGCAVAISGGTIVVGAQDDAPAHNLSGSAYVFVSNGAAWTQQAKLLPTDQAGDQHFGNSVAIDGDTVVVGASDYTTTSAGSGAVYVFTRFGVQWAAQAELRAPDAAQYDHFGTSVSLSGNVCVAGAPRHGADPSAAGAVYVFRRNGPAWSLQQEVTAGDPISGALFGSSVSVDGDTFAAGAEGANAGNITSGAAYVFTWNGSQWAQQAKLVPNDPHSDENMGNAMALRGDALLAGAYTDDHLGTIAGTAYYFQRARGVWGPPFNLAGQDTGGGDEFGSSVALDGATLVAGAWRSNALGTDSGAAYVFAPGLFGFNDILDALRMAGGLDAANTDSMARLNIVTSGASANRVDLADAVEIARKALGLDPNP